LQVADGKKEVVAQNLPRLQNAFLSDMMAYLPYQLRNSPKLDEAAVRRRLAGISDRILGAGLVLDVSIEQATVK
jgi:flagellar FliL protein